VAKTMRVWALSLELDSSMTMVAVSCGAGGEVIAATAATMV